MEIRLQDEQTYRWKGRMDFVDNALNTGSGTIRGRAVISNPGNFLTPGMFGHLRLLGTSPYRAMLVPDSAVTSDQTKQTVYVLDAQSVVRQQAIDPGPVVDGLRVVRSGLKPDDLVVIDGLQRVRPNDKAKGKPGNIVLKPPPPAANGMASQPPPAASATVSDAR